MSAKLIQVKYDRNGPTTRFVLLDTGRPQRSDEVICFDVTDAVRTALNEDRRNKQKDFTGKAFAWYLHQASEASKAHAELSEAWSRSFHTKDENFRAMVFHMMQMSPKSCEVVDLTTEDFQEALQKIKMDFRPKIGLQGTWRGFKRANFHVITEWAL